ncbi:MAG: RNA methyltransferase [Gammaproteobacteria bacterium]
MLAAFANLQVVLVGTTHPGNIGAAARAMKTMGLSRLCLVNPQRFPCAEATARAAGADDILHRAQVFPTLAEAVAGATWVVGSSARVRGLPWPTLTPRAWAPHMLAAARTAPVALVFGPEHSGLSNSALEHCQALVHIPTDAGFGSLNLAAAVQVLAYELRLAASVENGTKPERRLPSYAPQAELERLYVHLEQTMVGVGFLDPEKPRRLLRRMKRLLNRARLEQNEVNILRGFLTAIAARVCADTRGRD